MAKVDDLVASAKAAHDRYVSGRMDREIVRAWILGLGDYPSPYGLAVSEAKEWFKPAHVGANPTELKLADIERLHCIYSPGLTS